MSHIFELLKYTIPSITTGIIVYYFFKQYILLERSKQRFNLLNDKKKQSLKIKIQAYERMILFLHRIDLKNITQRIPPLATNSNKIEYAKILIAQINIEFEHNLVQQIYISENCWELMKNTKRTILNTITVQVMEDHIKTGIELQEKLTHLPDKKSPISIAQSYIRKELQCIL